MGRAVVIGDGTTNVASWEVLPSYIRCLLGDEFRQDALRFEGDDRSRSAPEQARLSRSTVSAYTRFMTMRRMRAIWSASAKPMAVLILRAKCELTLATTNTAEVTMQTRDAYPEFAASSCKYVACEEVSGPGAGDESAQSIARSETCNMTPKRKALRRPATVRSPTLAPVGSFNLRKNDATPRSIGSTSRTSTSWMRRVPVRISMYVRR